MRTPFVCRYWVLLTVLGLLIPNSLLAVAEPYAVCSLSTQYMRFRIQSHSRFTGHGSNMLPRVRVDEQLGRTLSVPSLCVRRLCYAIPTALDSDTICRRLAAGCTPSGSFLLMPLAPPSKSTNFQKSYLPPQNSKAATACICNAVAYSLIQACAVCQGGTPMWWSAPPPLENPTNSTTWWTRRCPPLYTTNYFPFALPNGTEVPDWATEVGVTVSSGVWDVTAAQHVASK